MSETVGDYLERRLNEMVAEARDELDQAESMAGDIGAEATTALATSMTSPEGYSVVLAVFVGHEHQSASEAWASRQIDSDE